MRECTNKKATVRNITGLPLLFPAMPCQMAFTADSGVPHWFLIYSSYGRKGDGIKTLTRRHRLQLTLIHYRRNRLWHKHDQDSLPLRNRCFLSKEPDHTVCNRLSIQRVFIYNDIYLLSTFSIQPLIPFEYNRPAISKRIYLVVRMGIPNTLAS